MNARRAAPLAALLALAACTQATVAPCPGDPVATLHFSGTREDAANECPSPVATASGGPATASFTGTLAYGVDGAAWLCLDRAEAAPLQGTHDGDHVVLSAPATVAVASGCTCTPSFVESLEGDLRSAAGGAVTFDGTLQDVFTTLDGSPTCSTDPASTCRIPCTQRWRVTGAP